jgi:hypothetical protein
LYLETDISIVSSNYVFLFLTRSNGLDRTVIATLVQLVIVGLNAVTAHSSGTVIRVSLWVSSTAFVGIGHSAPDAHVFVVKVELAVFLGVPQLVVVSFIVPNFTEFLSVSSVAFTQIFFVGVLVLAAIDASISNLTPSIFTDVGVPRAVGGDLVDVV